LNSEGTGRLLPTKAYCSRVRKLFPNLPAKKRNRRVLLGHSTQVSCSLLQKKKILNLSMTAVATGTNMAAESEKEGIYSKAEGKKRARDDDEDATATEGENSVTSNLSKKTRKR
jgi:hypothetical protein